METTTLEVKDKPEIVVKTSLSWREKLAAYVALTKPRIAISLIWIAATGFYLGSPKGFNWVLFAHSMFGITLLALGVAALNQVWERRSDALMTRTTSRPLPSGKLGFIEAIVFAILLTLAAEVYLAVLVNQLTAILGLTVIVGYVLLYTPLKTRTTLSTVIGAFPGAMPPLMGWTAAANDVTLGAWTLFVIQFLWQFPHFWAIAWLYREDYAKAGIKMLPVVEKTGKITAQQTVLFTLFLMMMSLAPFFLGFAGFVYLIGAVLLGIVFLRESIRFARSKSNADAKRLLRYSIIYLPILFTLLVLNHT